MGEIKMATILLVLIWMQILQIVPIAAQRPLSNSSVSTLPGSADALYPYVPQQHRSGKMLMPRPMSSQQPAYAHNYQPDLYASAGGNDVAGGAASIMDHAYGGTITGSEGINHHRPPYRPNRNRKPSSEDKIRELKKNLTMNSTIAKGNSNSARSFYGAAAGGAAGGGGSSSLMYRPPKNGKNVVDDSDAFTNINTGTGIGYENQRDDPSNPNKDPVRMIKNNFAHYLAANPLAETTEIEDVLGVKCTFETECAWTWDETAVDGFQVVTGANLTEANRTGLMPGPAADPVNNANGHFLHLRLSPSTTPRILKSPPFSSTRENCYLEVFIHQSSMFYGSLRIVIEPLESHESSWVPAEIAGDDLQRWTLQTFRIDRVSKDFQILFEVVPHLGGNLRGHVSIDNLKMRNCFPEGSTNDTCSASQVKCNSNKVTVCIKPPRICDINTDCDDNEDELLECDKMPFGSRCDFENGWCGWQNSGKAIMLWQRHSGATPTEKTGPDSDHTYESSNETGHYMYVNMNQHANDEEKKKLAAFASNAVMNSVLFNPPPPVHSNSSSPYRNSCAVRCYVHQFGMNAGSINLSIVEMKDKENITTTLWWSTKNSGEDWVRIDASLPNITSKYYVQFEARMGMRIYSDVAIDDFSLSPECFGLNIPEEALNGYNYWDPRIGITKQPHKDFVNKTYIELTTCGAKGYQGPSTTECVEAYNNTEAFYSIRVIDRPPHKGIQVWTVPNEGYYTVIAKGAGGGLGSGGVGSSRGAMAITILELHKNEEIYILVGQSGEHACIKSMGFRDENCETKSEDSYDTSTISKTHLVRAIVIEDGAGGGGGGSFVFLLNSANIAVPLVVAGGGGGLGIGRYLDDDLQHGQTHVPHRKDISGQVHGSALKSAGPGGGWRARNDNIHDIHFGASLLEGGEGGQPCYAPKGAHGQGGFGGGGGGCNTGGGGGGYAGGDTMLNSSNGEGATSYIGQTRSNSKFSLISPAINTGHGSVILIPAIEGCGCDYRCVALDEFRSRVTCICPDGWRLRSDNHTICEPVVEEDHHYNQMIHLLMGLSVILIFLFALLIFCLYNRFQRKRQAVLRHKMLLEQDLQLSRLRSTADDSALTNFNPNYGCDGILNGNVDVKSLPQVARESLRLVKALGQGAFGEVYQGLYRHRDGDAVEMPVAVKTLPEMSTGQAESDFLMEAAIMAKFNHPNIVHLIGVCFDRHPRFIVLELLAGGDLKNFLREGRNKPERPSPLTMKDLIFCALDVAKGCRYMESKRFIHRDIAARNCLLSSKGPGRVVKIADFGMARDIYRSDYYRKGGKAMLPIKWMPPEAFLDGIFTSKTDVWSFGVLLWEVFSLGLMPYTGLPNRDVMQLVTGGGRLDAPSGCPLPIYRIMAECWNCSPEERPTFSNLLERLTTCTQDPDVMNAPLPSIFRPPSTERDITIMRPTGNDDFCLQVPNSSDYLIPLPGPRSAAERLLCEATGVTIPDTMTTYTGPKTTSPGIPKHSGDTKCWETSFMMPNSKSDQPLLMPDGISTESLNLGPPLEKLISIDTPQQTPTTIKPPISFGTPLSQHHTTDATAQQTTHKLLDSISPPLPPPTQATPITLDPSALHKQQGTSYANVRMMNNTSNLNNLNNNNSSSNINNSNNLNNSINNNNNNNSINLNNLNNNINELNDNNNSINNSNKNLSTITAPPPQPFTIQGFNERYKSNENHSEISC